MQTENIDCNRSGVGIHFLFAGWCIFIVAQLLAKIQQNNDVVIFY